jgi:CBS domain-containing protein
MEKHQIRRVPFVDDGGACAGIIPQADIAWAEPPREVAELVREVSRETGRESRSAELTGHRCGLLLREHTTKDAFHGIQLHLVTGWIDERVRRLGFLKPLVLLRHAVHRRVRGQGHVDGE